MEIQIGFDQIDFVYEEDPTVVQLTGLDEGGNFTLEAVACPNLPELQRYRCQLKHGLYLVLLKHGGFIVLVPHRIKLTVAAAMELLAQPTLPPPRIIPDDVVETITEMVAQGKTWAAAATLTGIEKFGEPSAGTAAPST